MQQVVAPKGGGYTLLLVAAAALCFAFWLPSNSLILRLYAMVAERFVAANRCDHHFTVDYL
ncbi:hypothetical protein, partial [Herbaspirillum sp. B65]|uniref:hypothetical protein n=1 Tax=Herbaspirillum sp. B65 TaxID=137708 RepID=UPI001C26F118